MITYDKGFGGNRVLFRVYGSAFPRAMPYACLSAAIAATVSALFDPTKWQLFRNSYPLQLFFFIVGFMVIFRCALLRSPAAAFVRTRARAIKGPLAVSRSDPAAHRRRALEAVDARSRAKCRRAARILESIIRELVTRRLCSCSVGACRVANDCRAAHENECRSNMFRGDVMRRHDTPPTGRGSLHSRSRRRRAEVASGAPTPPPHPRRCICYTGRISQGALVQLAFRLLSDSLQRVDAEMYRKSVLVISREHGLRNSVNAAD